jgi:hypothetical protein
MQTNLHSFFTIKTIHNEKHKRCFVYDPTTYKAFFAVKPDDAVDRFICTKIGVKLCKRPTRGNKMYYTPSYYTYDVRYSIVEI